MAGLKVLWGFDEWDKACDNWRKNFTNSRCYQLQAHEFVQVAQHADAKGYPDLMKVDILHLSPPCQYFSGAHTVNGPNDMKNIASLYAVKEVIKVAKPRVVTLEQTSGLTMPRFKWFLNSLLQMFTSIGFSVRWTKVRFAQWVKFPN